MKSLIVYFSRTDENYMEDGIRNIEKGNTEIVAETIQKLTGADLFKVETVNEYPYDYYKCCDVAKEELENNERPNVKRKLDNIDDFIENLAKNYYKNIRLSHKAKLVKLQLELKNYKSISVIDINNSIEEINKRISHNEEQLSKLIDSFLENSSDGSKKWRK